ncbi:hypothetical protein DZC72_10310 [Maribacter algicola]|uniref:Uncharacterized protein n=1 Tax=Maribacter algicola TaxID=2498892 RepID=A0A3R8R1F1_9FLAO|nr:hypothetical protein [Maribacter algicola]RRQ48113.1 hypothetical protein DZC72_10310 [Maribacter algicola]
MKKIYLLFLVPFLFSFQCEDEIDPLYSSEFYIQNNSSIQLIWLNVDMEEIPIESMSDQFIGVSTDKDFLVPPSKTLAFNAITLYKKERSGDLTMVYLQRPIEDNLWSFDKLSQYEGIYQLIITNASLAP